MSPALLDTDVLSLYLRQGDIAIVDHCRRYIQRHNQGGRTAIRYTLTEIPLRTRIWQSVTTEEPSDASHRDRRPIDDQGEIHIKLPQPRPPGPARVIVLIEAPEALPAGRSRHEPPPELAWKGAQVHGDDIAPAFTLEEWGDLYR